MVAFVATVVSAWSAGVKFADRNHVGGAVALGAAATAGVALTAALVAELVG